MIVTRRAFAAWAAASPLLRAQREAPLRELVNVLEVEAAARRKLDGALFAQIAGGERRAFDRITFRPRLMVDTTGLDLSVELFGQKLFAPILAGPVARQARFYPDGETATARGATAAKAAMVMAADASVPLEQVTNAAPGLARWIQVSTGSDVEAARSRAREAVARGCRAVCLTLNGQWDWAAIDRFRRGLDAPLVLKGILNPQEARAAVERGVEGIIVSSYRAGGGDAMAAPIDALPAIVDAVSGAVPVLVDGGFRRGTDVAKALALGARAVLVARPVMWGLAAYGAEGVQYVLEMMQSELARAMAMIGTQNVAALGRQHVRWHRR